MRIVRKSYDMEVEADSVDTAVHVDLQGWWDDTGYDVSNYRKIHYEYGNDTDIEDLINAMHKRGMKLMMDFVPNHTSDQNSMFQASIK